MAMKATRLFQSSRTQAVRLTKDVAFPDDVREVVVRRDGQRRILTPAGSGWDDFFAEAGIDLGEREQGNAAERLAF
jgi:antitoxin VapB